MKKVLPFTLLCLLILMFFASEINAQNPEWTWANDANGSGAENIINVVETNDGSIVASGVYSGTFPLDGVTWPMLGSLVADGFVSKFNQEGEALWVVSIGSTSTLLCPINGLASDSEGNIYIAGAVIRLNDFGELNLDIAGITLNMPVGVSQDMYVAKLDANGNGIWLKSLSTPATPLIGSNPFLAIDENDAIYFGAGFLMDVEIDGEVYSSMGQGDLFLTRLDTDGNFVWATTLGSAGDEQFAKVSAAHGGGILMSSSWTGATVTVGGLSVTNPDPLIGANYDRWVSKIADDGTADWLVREGSVTDDYEGILVSTPSGGAMVLSIHGVAFEMNEISYPGPGYLLTRYSNSGVQEISVFYPLDPAVSWYGAGDISSDGNNTYYLGIYHDAAVFSLGDIEVQNTGEVNGTPDLVFAAVNPDGEPLWAIGAGSNDADWTNAMIFSETNGLIVGGAFQGESLELGQNILDNNGNFTTDFFLAALDLTNSILEAPGVKSLSVFPNPVESQFAIDLTEFQGQQITLNFIDNKGALVYQQSLSGDSVKMIEAGHLPTGIYALTIVANGTVYATKLLKK